MDTECVGVNTSRLLRYSTKAIIWRPISMSAALLLQTVYFVLFVPGFAGRVWEGFALSLWITIWVNIFLIPIGIWYEFIWKKIKKGVWHIE